MYSGSVWNLDRSSRAKGSTHTLGDLLLGLEWLG